jgi:hypothetical protein
MNLHLVDGSSLPVDDGDTTIAGSADGGDNSFMSSGTEVSLDLALCSHLRADEGLIPSFSLVTMRSTIWAAWYVSRCKSPRCPI